ncbi:hypothetical protein J7E73_03905 [Paenibacillus albidus]|uniref:hypothetical protein n=1 Tax=Paenibacillus albidus TaxID=2041023 RepID=UPI001BEB9ABE|nr:hypothetical protein [Paenibacillus albidus]MBT2288292.1 hypothetical protein [Paenibacillus albidus]
MKKRIFTGVVVVLAAVILMNLNIGNRASAPLTPKTQAPAVQAAEPLVTPVPQAESVIVGGEISASADGKKMSIWMAGGSSNNFGQETWGKGETISFAVKSPQEQTLEVGIMSVANLTSERADFEINLNKKLLSPLA